MGPKIRRNRSSISEINEFLGFTQKFKMAAKNGGNNFWGHSPVNSTDTLWVKISPKSLYLGPFPRYTRFCVLRRNSKWPQKMEGKRFLEHVASRICRYPVDQIIRQNHSVSHRF